MEPVIIVHGGAEEIPADRLDSKLNGVKAAAREGHNILMNGGSALDAVEAAIKNLENNEYFNAGYGAALNINGEPTMDASIMDGQSLDAGAVAVAKGIANPISLARLVMEKTPHVMLAANGVLSFAEDHEFPIVEECNLVTTYAKEKLNDYNEDTNKSGGTVGAVACDMSGHVAAGTSTGGTIGRMVGRVGDSCQIGSGTYADDYIGAVSCTGNGEMIIKYCLAHSIVKEMEKGTSVADATSLHIKAMTERLNKEAGAISATKNGEVAFYFTTPQMPWAYKQGDQLHFGVEQGQHEIETGEQVSEKESDVVRESSAGSNKQSLDAALKEDLEYTDKVASDLSEINLSAEPSTVVTYTEKVREESVKSALPVLTASDAQVKKDKIPCACEKTQAQIKTVIKDEPLEDNIEKVASNLPDIHLSVEPSTEIPYTVKEEKTSEVFDDSTEKVASDLSEINPSVEPLNEVIDTVKEEKTSEIFDDSTEKVESDLSEINPSVEPLNEVSDTGEERKTSEGFEDSTENVVSDLTEINPSVEPLNEVTDTGEERKTSEGFEDSTENVVSDLTEINPSVEPLNEVPDTGEERKTSEGFEDSTENVVSDLTEINPSVEPLNEESYTLEEPRMLDGLEVETTEFVSDLSKINLSAEPSTEVTVEGENESEEDTEKVASDLSDINQLVESSTEVAYIEKISIDSAKPGSSKRVSQGMSLGELVVNTSGQDIEPPQLIADASKLLANFGAVLTEEADEELDLSMLPASDAQLKKRKKKKCVCLDKENKNGK